MQPNRSEMQAMGTPMNGLPRSSKPPPAVSTQIALHEFHNSNDQRLIQNRNLQRPSSHFDQSPAAPDDFFDQMLSTIPSWPDLTKSHWDFTASGGRKQVVGDDGLHFTAPFDESSLLATRLRQQQIGSGGSLVGKPMVVSISAQPQQHQLQISAMAGSHQSTANPSVGDCCLFPTLPLSLGGPCPRADPDSSSKSPKPTGVGFNASRPQHFHHSQVASMPQQSIAGSPTQAPTASAIFAGANGGGAAGVTARPRVRARRGQATDPHSIAERLRRERIAERMKALQELVPNANKTDKSSMLDEIIDYVKFLQLQVKVLSMSRLGGPAAVSPLIADIPLEGRGSAAAASETLSVTENLVSKLMEEDMGSAMQYLQGKGLCLMPISLASAISTATSPSAAGRLFPGIPVGGDVLPSSPSVSALTVQSAVVGAGGDTCVSLSSGKDAA